MRKVSLELVKENNLYEKHETGKLRTSQRK